jgi:Asp-tRNA(Asn)/Glu-tRNA(Gln) amidotransferase C subunit
MLIFENQLRQTLQFAKINIIREKIDVLRRQCKELLNVIEMLNAVYILKD